jgi:hypothetical protein
MHALHDSTRFHHFDSLSSYTLLLQSFNLFSSIRMFSPTGHLSADDVLPDVHRIAACSYVLHHTHVDAYICIYVHTSTHTHAHTLMRIHTYTHTHTNIHIHTHTHTHIHTYKYIHAHTLIRVLTLISKHSYTHIRAYIHIHTHMPVITPSLIPNPTLVPTLIPIPILDSRYLQFK